jgi:hypothetical protein
MRPAAPRSRGGPRRNRLAPRRADDDSWPFRRLVRSNILGTEQYSAIVEQSSVELLDSAEFYHQAVRIKYSIERRLGKCVRLNRTFQRIHGEDAQYAFTAELV